MTYLNLIKNKIQSIFANWLEMLSIERELTDDQIVYMQFSICDYVSRQVENVPFFVYLFEFFLN